MPTQPIANADMGFIPSDPPYHDTKERRHAPFLILKPSPILSQATLYRTLIQNTCYTYATSSLFLVTSSQG